MTDRAVAAKLHEALVDATKTAIEKAERLGMPGEGAEREYRKELMFRVLVPLLGWPPDRIFQGERFDLLLNDDEGRPLINIETKSPASEGWTDAEERDFVERLGFYPTIRHAFITDGHKWKRLDLVEVSGRLRVKQAHEACP